MSMLEIVFGFHPKEWTIGVSVIADQWSTGFIAHLACFSLIVEW